MSAAPDDGELAELLEAFNPDALKPDGLEDAIIGIVERFGMTPVLLLDRARCIDIIMELGATYDEALEHFEYNVVGAWVGEHTPAYATLLSRPASSARSRR